MASTVLVLGPTDKRGVTVLEHLLSGEYGPFMPVAMTPHPQTEAEALPNPNNRSPAVCAGTLDDVDSYRDHLEHVDAAVLVTNAVGASHTREIDRGTNFIDAAERAGLDHIVQLSMLGATHTGAEESALLDAKRTIETYLQASDVPATIVRPGVLIQDLLIERDRIEAGELAWPVGTDTPLALVDVDDVGRTVAMALENPSTFVGREIDLAGDVLTLPEIADGLGEVLQMDVAAIPLTPERARKRFGEVVAEHYAWVEYHGGLWVDPVPLDALDIDPRSLHETLGRQPWIQVTDDAPLAD